MFRRNATSIAVSAQGIAEIQPKFDKQVVKLCLDHVRKGTMKELREVLRLKEQQFEQLHKEIDALQMSIRILETESLNRDSGLRAVSEMTNKGNGTNGRSNEPSAKQFP